MSTKHVIEILRECLRRDDLPTSLAHLIADIDANWLEMSLIPQPLDSFFTEPQKRFYIALLRDEWEDRLRAILERKLLSRLPHPRPLVLDDLLSLARLLVVSGPDAFEANYMAFTSGLLERSATCTPHTDLVYQARWDGSMWLPPDSRTMVLLYAPGLAVTADVVTRESLTRELSKLGIRDTGTVLEVQCSAHTAGFSDQARLAMLSETERILGACFEVLVHSGHCDYLQRCATNAEETEALRRVGRHPRGPDVDPLYCPEPDQNGLTLVRHCFEYYWERDPKLVFSRCMQNAIRLLVEAVEARHPAVGLAMCFAAIEALLCRSGDISDSVGRNAAALLQPDPRERLAVRKAIKSLYNERSEVVHGVRIRREEDSFRRSLTLACGVVKAMLDWRVFIERLGDTPTDDTFFEELSHAEASGQPMVGVPSRLAACLPDTPEGAN